MANEKIEVGYKRITGTEFYHKYILYTNENGEQFAAHGGPEGALGNWGHIKASYGEVNDLGVWAEEGEWDSRKNDFRELIIDGDDLTKGEKSVKEYFEDIKKTLDDIVMEEHDYHVLRQNSNSTVDTALHRVGLPLPKHDDQYGFVSDVDGFGDDVPKYYSPGSDNLLPGGPPADHNPTDSIPDPSESPGNTDPPLDPPPGAYPDPPPGPSPGPSPGSLLRKSI